MGELHSMHGLALFAAAVAGLAIAHRAVLRLPTGLPRLVFILPILPIFFMLPWTIPIYHLRAILSFIFLWTVPSKLLLLCWDAGIDYPSSGFLYFATIVMLPIRVRGKKAKEQGHDTTHKGPFWWQFIAVIIILNIYSYRKGLPIWAIYVLYACHIYLGLELMLGGLAKLATACFGVESDPQFNNPFMSASLSEFWGRRWNLVVTTILRSTVYNPALLLLMRAEKHQSKVPKTLSSTNLDPRDSCVQKTSPCSQERENPVASPDHQGMHSDNNLIATNLDRYAIESENTNLSFAKRESADSGFQIDDQVSSSGNVIDTHAAEASAENEHMNHNSLNFDTHLEPGLNPIPSHNLSTSSYSEGSRPEAEDGIKGTQELATEIKSCSHHNPISDMNLVHCTIDSNAADDPKTNPDFSACDPNPEPPNPTVTQQSVDNSISSTNLDYNPTSYLDPAISVKGVGDGMMRGMEKPSLRTRAAAMLRARAAAMLSDPLNPNPLPRSDPDPNNSNPTPSPELHPAMSKMGTEQKSGGVQKPSLRARAVAMLVTFAVSGLVHELIFYYINKSRATGEVTAFFMLHGCATALEVLLKKTMLAQVRLPRPLSIALTLAFLYGTAAWLFMPPLTRNNADINTIAEYQRLQSAFISLFTNRHTDR